MATDISKKRIIMIHGLASKPPQKSLDELWSKCIVENIRIDNPDLAKLLEGTPETFLSGYWANATPHHIEDDAGYVKKLRVQVDNVITARKRAKDKFHVGFGEQVGAFFKSKGEDLVKVLAGALTIQDEVMKTFLRETELYDEDQYIADRMREPLENALRQAWDDGCEVALLSHSMGTFISYDVLWRFSHRSEPEFSRYRRKRIKLFTTMGSPLGDGVVRDLLFARHHKGDGPKGRRQYPTNIDRWHNYACLGDVVAHRTDFERAFFHEMKKRKLLPESPKHFAIDYTKLHNPFEVVTHQGNKKKEKRNPHKSYGYLVQPRLGTWLADFLLGKLK
jgi:hypothetical protein